MTFDKPYLHSNHHKNQLNTEYATSIADNSEWFFMP